MGPLYIVRSLVWHSRGEIRMQNRKLDTAALTLLVSKTQAIPALVVTLYPIASAILPRADDRWYSLRNQHFDCKYR